MKDLICYCFEYSADDIRKDIKEHNGHSMILQEILAAKRTGGCQCAAKHPEGR